VYAPTKSTPYKLMMENNLGYRANNPNHLKNSIIEIIKNQPDENGKFLNIIKKYYSLETIRRKII
jgi:hypothetical protein